MDAGPWCRRRAAWYALLADRRPSEELLHTDWCIVRACAVCWSPVATVLIGVALFWDKLSGDGSPAVNPNVALTFTFPRAAVASGRWLVLARARTRTRARTLVHMRCGHSLTPAHSAPDNANCSQIGANIMSKGGNAADAAVSVALCLGVLQQFASGSGGGGIAMYAH